MEHLVIVPILLLLVVAHELGHFLVARGTGVVVEEFAIGFPPRIVSTVRGGVRYSLNAIPFGAYVKMLGEEDPDSPGSLASKSKPVRAFVLAAGSLANLAVAVGAFALAYGTGWPDPSVVIVRVAQVVPGSPADSAGLQVGDAIRFVDEREVRLPSDLREYTQQRLGQVLRLTIDRDGRTQTITLVPRTVSPEGEGPVGIRLQGRAVPVGHDPLSSVAFGVRQTLQMVGLTVAAPALVLRGELPAELVRPIGIPGMTQLAAEATTAAVESGWVFPLLLLTGVFSAGMAVANLLPIPALDGGRLLFLLVEAIRGRRIPPEREGLIHATGLVLLLSLIAAISLYDLAEPLPSIDWGLP